MSLPNDAIKPDSIEYWVHDRPPFSLSLLMVIQQIAFLGSMMTLPVVIGRAAGLDLAGEANLVALTMLGSGVGVMLQALNRSGVGSGLFAPMQASPVAFPAALLAVKTGGLGLAFGMMSIAGLVQIAVSRLIIPLRAFIPVEIAGLTVFMLGLAVGGVGLDNFLAINTEFAGDPGIFIVGFSTLAIIVSLFVWTKGHLQAFSVFTGLILGQALAYFVFDLVPQGALDAIGEAPAFAVPSIGFYGWSLNWALLPHFLIVGVVLSFGCFGVMTIAQRANDAHWKRPDMAGIKRGLMAEGMTNIFCSLINGIPQTTSGGAVVLSQASGVTSRVVAFLLGLAFIGLAFFPPIAMIWSTLSPVVIGAALIFVASFIVVAGLKILTSILLDSRRTLTLGLAIIAGVSHNKFFAEVGSVPGFLDAAMSTSLSVTVLAAIFLNALFRLGSKKTMSHSVCLAEDWRSELNHILWQLGRAWSARPEAVARLEYAANELIDTISGYELIEGEPTVGIAARFDEYQCQLIIDYQGESINIPKLRPDPESLLDNPDGVRDMAGYLIKRLANKVNVNANKGRVQLTLLFKE